VHVKEGEDWRDMNLPEGEVKQVLKAARKEEGRERESMKWQFEETDMKKWKDMESWWKGYELKMMSWNSGVKCHEVVAWRFDDSNF
jgi:hypothetical protein